MKFRRLSFVFIPALIILSGCVKILNEDLTSKEKRLVLNAAVGSDSVFTVNLSHTFNIFADESANNLPFIDGATVKLYENGNFIVKLENTGNGYYRYDGFFPVMGKEYTVTASYGGYKTIEAKTSIPQKVPIASFDTTTVTQSYDYGNQIIANIKYNDPPGVQNFYMLSCYVKNKSPEGEYVWYKNDLWVSETSKLLFDNDNGDILWSDKYSDGKEVTLDIGFAFWYPEGRNTTETDTLKYIFQFKSITKEFYTYLKSLNVYYETGGADDPFVEPVVIYSNVDNGYGILGGYSQDTAGFTLINVYGDRKGGGK